jgi:hypothetical protein
MIVAIGIDVDPTFVHFVSQAVAANVALQVVNLRAAVEGDWIFELPPDTPAILRHGNEMIHLRPEDRFFCRLIDLSSQCTDPDSSQRWRGFLGGLRTWLDVAPGLVVNRERGGAHNGSKPLHESVLRDMGFRVPESITSSNLAHLRQFIEEGPTISKTVCGTRADTAMVELRDLEGFQNESGPVHLQRFVPGADARIHVIDDCMVAQRVSSGSVDYRRAGAIGDMEIFEPPPALFDLLIEGTRNIGLVFAGWDFKVDGAGEFWCLEVNPMPGYSPYDSQCDGMISRKLIAHLEDFSSSK